jgi:phosphoesterase RecJ-like protein
MNPLAELIIEPSSSIIITTHQNPDADALGSSLGLAQYLQVKGHQVTVISSTPFPQFLNWMPGAADILIYEKDPEKVNNAIAESTYLFCLDFNIISRTKTLEAELKNYSHTKILIDHHIQPDIEYFNYGISMPEKSSTCEMIYDYICAQDSSALITKSIADCLYAGCMTDTGSFRFSNTTADTHKMIATLISCGAVPDEICTHIYDTYGINRIQLVGHVLANKLKIYTEQAVALIYIEADDYHRFNIQQGDTEGIVNMPLAIQDIRMAVLITDKEKEIRMSFRSKGDLDVHTFAKKYFNGGGHRNAAGGKGLDTLKNTIDHFETAIKEYI